MKGLFFFMFFTHSHEKKSNSLGNKTLAACKAAFFLFNSQ